MNVAGFQSDRAPPETHCNVACMPRKGCAGFLFLTSVPEYGPSPPLLCKSATVVAGSFQRFSANLPRDSPWGPEDLPGTPLKLSAAPPPCLSWFLPLILSYYSRTVLSMLFSDTVWSESGIREAGG